VPSFESKERNTSSGGLPLWEWYLNIVEKQYRDASNLKARVALQARLQHQRLRLAAVGVDRLETLLEARVLGLKLRSGPSVEGDLDRIPEGWSVTLTDASFEMLDEAAGATSVPPAASPYRSSTYRRSLLRGRHL